MSGSANRVRVWSAQFRAGDFPPVCAMTGSRADTWGTFRFKTVPRWAEMSGAAGLAGLHLLGPLVEEATMRRAKGRLPLSKSSKRMLRIVNVGLLSLIPAGFALVVGAVAINSYDPANASIGGTLGMLGLLALLAGGFGVIAIPPRFGPGGVVLPAPRGFNDYVVELRRVHPAFVAAVQQHQQARAAQR